MLLHQYFLNYWLSTNIQIRSSDISLSCCILVLGLWLRNTEAGLIRATCFFRSQAAAWLPFQVYLKIQVSLDIMLMLWLQCLNYRSTTSIEIRNSDTHLGWTYTFHFVVSFLSIHAKEVDGENPILPEHFILTAGPSAVRLHRSAAAVADLQFFFSCLLSGNDPCWSSQISISVLLAFDHACSTARKLTLYRRITAMADNICLSC